MYNAQDRFDITAKAMGALHKLRSNKYQNLNEQKRKKPDYSQYIFEEYDEESFENKIKIDSIYYKVLLNNLNENYVDKVRNILTSVIENVREIYEQINIKPKTYGFNSISIFNETDTTLQNNGRTIINEFINQRYYSLDKDKREKMYLERCKPIAQKLVMEHNNNYDDAIRFATKAVVIEDLIRKINFPQTVWGKIEELKNDTDSLFDQDHLITLLDNFDNKIKDVSKIVAAIV